MTPPPRPTPVDREAPFGIDELFFSTTDAHSHIRDGNDVFVRVSGYERDTLVGATHNIVRHPDMPRGVFRLFWQRLEARQPVAAYVKNMSADGGYYWVMAVAVPSSGGFLSVRLKPSSAHFDAVAGIYGAVREIELALEEEGLDNPSVAQRGYEALMEHLREAGFPDYEAFERTCLPAEIVAREEALSSTYVDTHANSSVRTALRTTADSLSDLFRQVAEYQEGSRALESSSRTVRSLAEAVRLNAVNGLVAAARLSADGATLAVVADRMTHAAHDISGLVATLDSHLTPAIDTLGDLAFHICAAKMQVDMAQAYASEDEAPAPWTPRCWARSPDASPTAPSQSCA